jgi:GT2 family glycosyltransferase
MSNYSIAACVLFFEKVDQTIECIGSLLPSDIMIYILNNNSSQWARNKLGEFCSKHHQVKIFDSAENLGVGVGRNYLISNTTEEWLLFIDNDIVMKTPDWIRKVTSHIFQNKNIEVFIPKLFNVHENNFDTSDVITIEGNSITLNRLVDNVSNCFPGGASFVNRRLFDRAGLYDDRIFVGFEDFEFSIRCMLTGNPVSAMIIPDIELIHDHRQVMKSEDKKAVLTRYDMSTIDKSFKRIAEKYPDFCFKHKWRPWVIGEIKKLLPKEDLGFTMTTSLNDVLNSFVRKMEQNMQRVMDALLPIGSRSRLNVNRLFKRKNLRN